MSANAKLLALCKPQHVVEHVDYTDRELDSLNLFGDQKRRLDALSPTNQRIVVERAKELFRKREAELIKLKETPMGKYGPLTTAQQTTPWGMTILRQTKAPSSGVYTRAWGALTRAGDGRRGARWAAARQRTPTDGEQTRKEQSPGCRLALTRSSQAFSCLPPTSC
jgi:hypothetical protein